MKRCLHISLAFPVLRGIGPFQPNQLRRKATCVSRSRPALVKAEKNSSAVAVNDSGGR